MNSPVRKGIGKIGLPGYGRILAAALREPIPVRTVEELTGVNNNTARMIMRKLKAVGLVHVAAWSKRETKGYEALWGFGDKVEPPYPGGARRPQGARATNMSAQGIAMAVIIRQLELEPTTVKTLAEVSGMTWADLNRILKGWGAAGLVRVADWDPPVTGGVASRMYAIGPGPTPKRPKGLTEAEKCRRYKAHRDGRAAMLTMIRATAANDHQLLEAA